MRRSKNSLPALLASMPWSVSAGIGLVGAVALFGVARKIDSLMHSDELALLLQSTHASNLLRIIAFVLLLLCFIAALQSAAAARRRRDLLEGQRDMAAIKRLSWQDFELLVAEAYRRIGYTVEEVGQGGADGGVDLVMKLGGRRTLVQCKRWNSSSIGAPIVREMYGLMLHHEAHEVKIVCAGKFTKEATRFAAGKPIDLVGGEQLMALIDSVRDARGDTASTCLCGAPMIERRSGTSRFLGCTRYPGCHVTRPLQEKQR